MNDEMIKQIESLKSILVSHATGDIADDSEYSGLRATFIRSKHIAPLLPSFIHSCRNLSEFWGFIKPKFPTYKERREFLRKKFDPLFTKLETESHAPSDLAISTTISSVNSGFIQEAWQKAIERRTSDPEGAITSARTLLECVCRFILNDSNINFDENSDLPKLYSLTSKQLNLSPSQHTEKVFKQILGGCHAVVEGLGTMRNRHSDAHGKSIIGMKPASRHAELAVNLSGAMATFLLQTWAIRKK